MITSNYRQTCLPNKRLSFVASSIVELSMKSMALKISVCIDDWTAERAIIASKGSGGLDGPR